MKIKLTAILLSITALLYSQTGNSSFNFLSLPTGARQEAFGGSNISIYDNDLNFAFTNPALLSTETHNILGVNYTNLFNDVNIASAIYGRNFGEKNFTAYGFHYIDYGSFIETSITNEMLGKFTAKDMTITSIYGRWLSPRWSAGIALKTVCSVYEQYSSWGMAADIGFSYHNEKALFSAGLVLRNAGVQFNSYSPLNDNSRRMLPIDLQIGISQKLPKAPIRFSLTLHNLQTWDLSAAVSDNTEDRMAEKSKAQRGADMFFRHTIWSVEILPMKNFYIVASYNHRRRMDMSVQSKRSIAGFSFGAGLTVKNKISVGFSVVPYQSGSLGYNVTISTNLKAFGVK